MQHAIASAVSVLRAGGTILYPTDTIWGIGCDARNADAVARLYEIKKRDPSKSMLILCTESITNLNACPLLATHTSRPTTYILPERLWHKVLTIPIAPNLYASNGSLGIRLPKHHFCQEVINSLGSPLVSTSANFSGQPSPRSYADISEALKQRVDFLVPSLPEFQTGESQGSRIIRINTDGSTDILRP
ncbi:MAG: L-threonylcarbamoyladenylate synthase [Bacteroidales bacterium]|nr:L-threonylcarbamoyladenylate synthase [Bacteroidales bacterium]